MGKRRASGKGSKSGMDVDKADGAASEKMDTADGLSGKVWNSVTGTWAEPAKAAKVRPGPRGANTKIQKKRKMKGIDRAVQIAQRQATKKVKLQSKTDLRKVLKDLY